MIYVLGGFCVALAAVVMPLVFIPSMHVRDYPDIDLACKAIFEEAAACKTGAVAAGHAMVGALSVALVLAGLMPRRWRPQAAVRAFAPWTYTIVLVLVTALVGAHVMTQFRGPFSISRIANITRESAFISLENLTWPVLLQMMNSQRRLRDKFFCLSLLLPIITLSPYRAIVVALVLCGFVLPVCERWWDQAHTDHVARSGNVKYILISLAALLVLSASIYSQTRGRLVPSGSAQAPAKQTEISIVQRLTYPLFQAHLAAAVSAHEPVPTIGNDILKKLRLSRKPNLNEFLYGMVYGAGTAGEMTSLYYGEAAAYSKSPPIIWITVAPLLMAAAWLLFRRHGYETGTLVGIAIWRGSLGGLVDLLPALVLQLLAMIVLCWDPLRARPAT